MSNQDPTVNAGDIARLADVGRAAVSNWRRRHEDFPRPVGGTASSPLFSLREIQDWLRRNGKRHRLSDADLAWQRLRASGDDLRLGHLVGRAGAFLLGLRDPALRKGLPGDPGDLDDPGLARLLTDLAEERGHREAFEFLCERYAEAHSRQLFVTPAPTAALMSRLALPAGGGTLLDPACGVGTLLLAEGAPGGRPARALGQELGEAAALISAVRLRLAGLEAHIVAGDSLRDDALDGELADAVVCDPPFNERAWGHAELTGDPRWEYGTPPRGEPELAWVQHCLAHVRPGGLVAILMPTAAAGRRPGRRIRANLLRAGALRAVVTLPGGGPDLWLLRRPVPGERPRSHILLMEAEDLSAVPAAWEAYLADPEAPPAVRIIELLDDDVDLSPARQRLRERGPDLGADFAAALEAFSAPSAGPPELDVLDEPQRPPTTTIGELAKAGLVTVHHSPVRPPSGDGETPVLLADDLVEGTTPTGRAPYDSGLTELRAGDVVASPIGHVRVLGEDLEPGTVLGPNLTLYRVDPERLDAHFLAGFLRSADLRPNVSHSRLDARRTRVPRLSLRGQRAYGEAFRRLAALEDEVRRRAELGRTLVRLGFDGLIDGHLRPRSRPEVPHAHR
ncbi:HsdM family class I SAM-dependent methyltransferase [Bailinhaonella thermotolerans]|uniref:HsdM family class I SAM-dependent methyltransferase n=1 Tax=Bailinhaonella thermotolerans TaxID=1070861 RepID=UPI001F5BE0B1|nr:N-6 DNA methylase [Bailinhaonella thermotolerans]